MMRRNLRVVLSIAVVMAGLLVPARLLPQKTESRAAGKTPAAEQAAPVAAAPCAPQAPPQTPAQKAHAEQMKNDWPWLGRYKQADLELGPPVPGEERVVFMGASITERWKFAGPHGFFPGKPYINRGISGQTSPQMLLRFRQDVIDLQPKAVVILIGTNDVAGMTGPITAEQTEENVESMADLATANHIRVVLCAMLPSSNIPWKPDADPAPKIVALNQWFKAYAASKGYVYVAYYPPMKDQQGGLPAALSKDGVHPTAAGYAIMAPLVEAGIEKALNGGE
jgi:lysophospholipase L1-like esterase